MVDRAEIVREKGTNRNQFFRGMVDKYTWVDVGSSYLPSDLLAAFLLAQLEARDSIQRKRIWNRYAEGLTEWALANGARLPAVPGDREQAHHMFYLLLPSLNHRQALIQRLKEEGILSVFHYVPLHSSTMGLKMAARPARCPVTEDVSGRLIRLPFYNDLTATEQDHIVNTIQQFSCCD